MDADELSHCFIVTSNHTLKSGPYCPLRLTGYPLLRAEAVPFSLWDTSRMSRNMQEVEPLGCMSLLPPCELVDEIQSWSGVYARQH